MCQKLILEGPMAHELALSLSGVSSEIVQKYCPRNLSLVDIISVSDLDVSKDGKELLVSYESRLYDLIG